MSMNYILDENKCDQAAGHSPHSNLSRKFGSDLKEKTSAKQNQISVKESLPTKPKTSHLPVCRSPVPTSTKLHAKKTFQLPVCRSPVPTSTQLHAKKTLQLPVCRSPAPTSPIHTKKKNSSQQQDIQQLSRKVYDPYLLYNKKKTTSNAIKFRSYTSNVKKLSKLEFECHDEPASNILPSTATSADSPGFAIINGFAPVSKAETTDTDNMSTTEKCFKELESTCYVLEEIPSPTVQVSATQVQNPTSSVNVANNTMKVPDFAKSSFMNGLMSATTPTTTPERDHTTSFKRVVGESQSTTPFNSPESPEESPLLVKCIFLESMLDSPSSSNKNYVNISPTKEANGEVLGGNLKKNKLPSTNSPGPLELAKQLNELITGHTAELNLMEDKQASRAQFYAPVPVYPVNIEPTNDVTNESDSDLVIMGIAARNTLNYDHLRRFGEKLASLTSGSVNHNQETSVQTPHDYPTQQDHELLSDESGDTLQLSRLQPMILPNCGFEEQSSGSSPQTLLNCSTYTASVAASESVSSNDDDAYFEDVVNSTNASDMEQTASVSSTQKPQCEPPDISPFSDVKHDEFWLGLYHPSPAPAPLSSAQVSNGGAAENVINDSILCELDYSEEADEASESSYNTDCDSSIADGNDMILGVIEASVFLKYEQSVVKTYTSDNIEKAVNDTGGVFQATNQVQEVQSFSLEFPEELEFQVYGEGCEETQDTGTVDCSMCALLGWF